MFEVAGLVKNRSLGYFWLARVLALVERLNTNAFGMSINTSGSGRPFFSSGNKSQGFMAHDEVFCFKAKLTERAKLHIFHPLAPCQKTKKNFGPTDFQKHLLLAKANDQANSFQEKS